MVSFPPCKINLGLNILRKRADGFHNLETVFYPLGLKDGLEIIPTHNTNTPITFTASQIPGQVFSLLKKLKLLPET